MRQWRDIKTGEVVLTEIELWPRNVYECPLCEKVGLINHAVAFYCEPTHDEIGSVSTQYRNADGSPAIVGGMACCKGCHDKHYRIGIVLW